MSVKQIESKTGRVAAWIFVAVLFASILAVFIAMGTQQDDGIPMAPGETYYEQEGGTYVIDHGDHTHEVRVDADGNFVDENGNPITLH